MEDLELIATKVFASLKQKNIPPTPENYEKEFFYISKEHNINTQEEKELEEAIENLCKSEKRLIDINNKSFRKLTKLLKDRIDRYQIKQFLSDLSYFMKPSLSNELKDDIDILCKEISENPNKLINIDNIRKLRKLTDLRIENDNAILDEKSDDVKKLIGFLSDILEKTVKENCISVEKVITIKDEVSNLDLSDSSIKHIKILHTKILGILEKLEESVQNSSRDLLTTRKDTEVLHNQIEELKKSLNKAEEEKSTDFLTGIMTRRAYSYEVERVENEFNIFDVDYALIFFDIDYFKKINDTYGHDCGDNVLFTFATILNKLTRSEDIICRYGGEEFVAIIHYKNVIEVKNYLRGVKNIITGNKFIYKENKIEVKFSAGVALRRNYSTYDDTLRKADKLLYKAKDKGRNKIILDSDEEF